MSFRFFFLLDFYTSFIRFFRYYDVIRRFLENGSFVSLYVGGWNKLHITGMSLAGSGKKIIFLNISL